MRPVAPMAGLATVAGHTDRAIDAGPPAASRIAPPGLPRQPALYSGPLSACPARVAPAAVVPRPPPASGADLHLRGFRQALQGLAQMTAEQRDAAHRQMPQKIRELPPAVQLRAWELWIDKIPKANPRAGQPHPRQFVHDALKDLPADLRAKVALRLMDVLRNHTDLDLLLSAVLVKANPETPREEVEAVLYEAELAHQDAKRERPPGR